MTAADTASARNELPTMRRPHDRQVLACLGNRYVVFGSGADLPDRRRLGPEDVTVRLPRIGEARDEAESRIAQTLVVDGFEVRHVEGLRFGDLMILDGDGRSALVEIKVGDRDFAGLDLGRAWSELAPSAEAGERREIWAFNMERLNLGIVWSEGWFAPSFEQLAALNVWEFNADGSTFERSRVVEKLDDWLRRIEALYADVVAWTRADGLDGRRDRTVPMSEELMQNFAVPDRDAPILDVLDGGKPVVSFVPAGLWMLGFDGLIDVITRHGTHKLGMPHGLQPPRWVVIDPRTRRQTDWNSEALRSILGLMPAGE